MKNSNIIREINDIERGMILKSLLEFAKNMSRFLEENDLLMLISIGMDVYLEENEYPSIFLVKRELNEFYEKKLKGKKLAKVALIGIYFGFIKKGTFHISLEGAELLLKKGFCDPNKIVEIDEISEKIALYGNNLLKKNLNSISEGLHQGDLVLLTNKNEELVSITRLRIDSNDFKTSNSNKEIAISLVDKGYYLRIHQ